MPADKLRSWGREATPRLPGRFRAVVFDMDGLLVDSEPLWHRAEARLLRERGLDQPVLAKASTV
ncbi:MAG TPA: hypothetical protein VLS28_00400, partial [Candidatus Sulfomarinibacteraceae bacterium]|nr:hypothetical protein [Candidatus Sulfomarinibacteraceae bacterium]